jgi:hypothetical protein
MGRVALDIAEPLENVGVRQEFEVQGANFKTPEDLSSFIGKKCDGARAAPLNTKKTPLFCGFPTHHGRDGSRFRLRAASRG